MALAMGPRARPAAGVLAWLGITGAAILLGSGTDRVLALSALLVVVVTALMASVGAGMTAVPGRSVRCLAWGLLGAGLVSAVLGLLQYYGLAEPLLPWTTAPDLGQAFGNLRQRNQFATLLSMALIGLLWLHASTGTTGAPRPLHRRLAFAASALLLLVALAASTSRTGLLQLVAIVGCAAWMARRERHSAPPPVSFRLPSPWALLALIPIYALAAWLLPHLAGGEVEGMAQRLSQGAPIGHSRLLLWGNVLDLISVHPWTGWGWGELKYAHFSTHYDGPRFAEILDNAHNLPLHLAVELGIPAALLICAGFGWLVLAARPWRETDPARLMAWGVLGVLVLHSLLEYPLWYGPFQLVFGLCLGLLWPGRAARGRSIIAGAWLANAATAALLAIVGYAAWDYTRISQLFLEGDERLPAWRDDTLAKVQGSWLFAGPVDFARLVLTPVNHGNAAEVHQLAEHLLHFSPEPTVVLKLIDSAMLMGREDEALAQAARFESVYPADYARWLGVRPAREGSGEPAPPDAEQRP